MYLRAYEPQNMTDREQLAVAVDRGDTGVRKSSNDNYLESDREMQEITDGVDVSMLPASLSPVLSILCPVLHHIEHVQATACDYMYKHMGLINHLHFLQDVFLLRDTEVFEPVRALVCDAESVRSYLPLAAVEAFAWGTLLLPTSYSSRDRSYTLHDGIVHGGSSAHRTTSPALQTDMYSFDQLKWQLGEGMTTNLSNIAPTISGNSCLVGAQFAIAEDIRSSSRNAHPGSQQSMSSQANNASQIGGAKHVSSLDLAGALNVQLAYPWPLCEVITQVHVERYNAVLGVLLQLALVKWAMEAVWLGELKKLSSQSACQHSRGTPKASKGASRDRDPMPKKSRSGVMTFDMRHPRPGTTTMPAPALRSAEAEVFSLRRNCYAGLLFVMSTVRTLHFNFMNEIHGRILRAFEEDLRVVGEAGSSGSAMLNKKNTVENSGSGAQKVAASLKELKRLHDDVLLEIEATLLFYPTAKPSSSSSSSSCKQASKMSSFPLADLLGCAFAAVSALRESSLHAERAAGRAGGGCGDGVSGIDSEEQGGELGLTELRQEMTLMMRALGTVQEFRDAVARLRAWLQREAACRGTLTEVHIEGASRTDSVLKFYSVLLETLSIS
jgi:hypothetical protein